MDSDKIITLADCKELYQRFQKYTKTAEQHEFPLLMRTEILFNKTPPFWTDPIDQEEAQCMFRAVELIIGKQNEEKN